MNAILGTRMTDRGRVTLSDRTFRIFDLVAGTMEAQVITDFAAYLGHLERHLGVELNAAESALFKQRFANFQESRA